MAIRDMPPGEQLEAWMRFERVKEDFEKTLAWLEGRLAGIDSEAFSAPRIEPLDELDALQAQCHESFEQAREALADLRERGIGA
jgi:FMN phosphatase YigB (HAD superfamily)